MAFVPSTPIPAARAPLRSSSTSARFALPHPARSSSCTAPRMVARPENEPDAAISSTVERLYDRYPFPPETLLDEAPLGYNWRWHYPSAYAFCTGRLPPSATADGAAEPPRILDAGCGTGESTSYLVHLNPGSSVVAIDLSDGALDVARERLDRALPAAEAARCEFRHMSIFDVDDLPGQFDLINCVGVVHHTPDPLRAVRALAAKLRPGGILHIFVYAVHGRWEISLMQRALRLLQAGEGEGDDGERFESGVQLGRRVFAALPDGNRLKRREEERWAQENLKDATFADMYLHPQEVDYDILSLFELIDASGLEFVGFSNPRTWDLSRLLSADDELLRKANTLPERERVRLVELLDPEAVTHFEFFLAKPPLRASDWGDDAELGKARAFLSECVVGWPSKVLMDRDYTPVMLSEEEHGFIESVVGGGDGGKAVREGVQASSLSLDGVRGLVAKGVVVLQESR